MGGNLTIMLVALIISFFHIIFSILLFQTFYDQINLESCLINKFKFIDLKQKIKNLGSQERQELLENFSKEIAFRNS